MKDLAPDLLEKLQEDFRRAFNSNEKIKKLNSALKSKKATYKEANELSMEIGDILAEVYKKNIKKEDLPGGKLHYNIAKRVIEPTMKENYDLVSTYSQEVQTALNKSAGLDMKGVKADLNRDRIDNLIDKVSQKDDFDEAKWLLDEPVKNFTQSVVDDTIRANADFQYKAGLEPKIIRRAEGNCCEWCSNLAGVYDYKSAPKDVYRRHKYCRCTLEYFPGDGKKQDVWSKEWRDLEKDDKIEIRKSLNISKSDKKARIEKAEVKGYDIDERKLTEYAINYDKQPDKAKAFDRALGYNLSNYETLIEDIKSNLKEDKFISKGDKGYGETFEQIIELVGPNGKKANVLMAWVQDGDKKRLVSLYVTKRKGK